jgi:hypothetical protein
MDKSDMYRIFHPTTMEITFLLAHRIFSEINHILWHEETLNKIISGILSDCSEVKVKINSKRNYTNTWRLSNTLLGVFLFFI